MSAREVLQATAKGGGSVDGAGAIIDHLDLWTGAVTKKSSSGRGNNGKIELTGIKKLRELIFELASRGALIPKVNDSARILKLQEFAELVMGQAPPGSECNKNGIGEIFVKTGEFGAIYPEVKEWTTKPLRMARQGDVLICVVGATVGKLNMAIDCAIGRSVAAIRPDETVIPEYLYYCLIPFTLKIRSQSKGSAQGVIGKAVLNNVELRVPPIDEQKQIVQKVDELMALCDRLEQQTSDQLEAHETLVDTLLATLTQAEDANTLADAWARLAAHFDTLFTTEQSIDKLKQTILQLAVMGRLVEQDAGDGTAKELLAGIERQKQEFVKAKKIKPPKKLPAITAEEALFDIPQNWQWVKFGELGLFINGDRSKNYPNKEEYVERGVAWINTGHIEPDGTLTQAHMNFITREKFDSLRSGKIKATDLVYCLRGATFGKTAFVTPYEEGAIASSLMIIRPYLPAMRSYIYRYLTSPFGRSQIFRFDNGSAQPNLSANSVMMYAFPLPPLEEQHRIVRKVDELMALCDRLKERLSQARETRCHLAEAVVEKGLSA